jgi:hypothetical protein
MQGPGQEDTWTGRTVGSLKRAGMGTEYTALAELGQVLQSAGPIQRYRLDIGLGRTDTVGRACAGLRGDGGLGVRAAAQRPTRGAHDR